MVFISAFLQLFKGVHVIDHYKSHPPHVYSLRFTCKTALLSVKHSFLELFTCFFVKKNGMLATMMSSMHRPLQKTYAHSTDIPYICGDLTGGGSGFKLKDFSQKNYLGC